MKSTLAILWAVLSLALPISARSMSLDRVGHDLFATGATTDQDFLKFKQAFAEPGIERLILINGPGGDLWTGMQIARIVQDAHIKTVVSGHCMSACSLIFMAGQARAFGTGHLPRVTMVGIHGAHLQDTKQIHAMAMPQMYALYKQQMGDQFDRTIIGQALYDIKDAQGFLRIRELERNQDKDRTPWFCPTGQTPFEQCEQHHGKDAHTLGVVTQRETEKLTLPQSMLTPLGFYGRTLPTPSIDLQERASQLIEQLCADRLLCKTIANRTMGNYLSANMNKAMAIGWGKSGFGVRWGADDAGMAMLKAMYNCNHAKNNPKLCRLVAVNDHELLPYYTEAPAQAQALLNGLNPPDQTVDQAERNEVGARSPTQLVPLQKITGMTPAALHGIERWDTGTLVKALTQEERPVLIDVAVSGPMLPGALHFHNGGLYFDNEQQETAYAERFRNMLNAAAPRLDQTVVFYCASSECWLSVNAAMRAQQLGYTQIKWYRGGLQAWSRAGLPLTDRLPVAVLY